jgi:hydrogenase large subunit
MTTAQRVVVDPITRIEGHLRIEAETDADGKITSAYSAGTMVRGIEIILRGRDPRDAWAFAQRICGVCTLVHGIASVRSVEDALHRAIPSYSIPQNAELIRNLMIAAQYVHDHVMHFYHLHALDWVDVVSALQADPKATSALAQSISGYSKSSPGYFADAQKRVKTFVEQGQLGIFANAYWGHPAYKLPPEANLMAVAHYLDALAWQRDVVKLHAIFGGKNPHPNFVVGGVPSAIADRGHQRRRAVGHRTQHGGPADGAERHHQMREFVDQVYVPDTLAIAGFYKDWGGRGEGLGNFMTFGDLPSKGFWDTDSYLIPRGVILNRDLSTIHPIDLDADNEIQEFVSHSWYKYSQGDAQGLHPFKGETELNYTGPKPPYQHLDVEQKYSWMKSPRWKGHSMEVGPLARVLMLYASGNAQAKELVGLHAEDARRAGRRAVLHARPHRRAHAGIEDPGRCHAGLVRPADGQHQGRRRAHLQRPVLGSVHLAQPHAGRRPDGSAARRLEPLDRGRRRQDQQLPGGGTQHLERRPARHEWPAGRVRSGAAGQPRDARSQAADRDPAHHPFLRSLHRLRGARDRPGWRGTGAGEDQVMPTPINPESTQ